MTVGFVDAKKLNRITAALGEATLQSEAFDSNVLPTAFALNTYQSNKHLYVFSKRVFDIVLASIGFVILLPLFALIAVAIKIETPGPVFFIQSRVGKGLVFFNIIKFRTMYSETPSTAVFINDPVTNEIRRPTINEDARITRVGRMLRALSLDEIPQLFNILLGEMSFIGPRPLTIEESLKVPTEAICRYWVKPGLSGIAQLRNRSAIHTGSRFNGDIEYVMKRSSSLDLKMFFKSLTKFYNKY
jgi:lipopolysaccharide/colanic/teichoic acid biosynthesis glycosyltransferase